MVEFGRFAQVKALKARGWTTDWETERFDRHANPPGSAGGPEHMKDPDGRIHAVSCGTERLIAGNFVFDLGPPLGERTHLYRAGKLLGAQG